jgi:hypothetical protein
MLFSGTKGYKSQLKKPACLHNVDVNGIVILRYYILGILLIFLYFFYLYIYIYIYI